MTGPRTLAVDYDLYEVAYLAGGPRRAVDAAVVALVESGRVTVDRANGQLSVTDARRSHSVEAAVLDAIGVKRHRTIATLRWRVESDERVTALRHRPERDGLLRASASTSRRYRAWQTFALTGEGRRTLRHLRSLPPAPGTSAMQVALVGVGAMADPGLRSALFEPPAPPRPRNRFTHRRNPSDAGYGRSSDAGIPFAGPGDGQGFGGRWGDAGGWGGGFGDGGGGGGDGGGGT